MKKESIVLKVGIGLVLGVGAMTFVPKAAHAVGACPPLSADCPPPPNMTNMIELDTIISDACLPTDCDDGNKVLFSRVYEQITYFAPGLPPEGQECDKTVYTAQHPC